MIMEAVCRSTAFTSDPNAELMYRYYLKRSEAEIQTQAQRTGDFLLLYDYLLKKGLRPIVMKGIICRSLYPEPEHRPSVDEDLLIDPQDFLLYHRALLEYGMELVGAEEDIGQAHEVSYQNRDTLLYIEVHKHPFPPDDRIFGRWNLFFDRDPERYVRTRIYGNDIYTLDINEHLIYLILHAYKHFLYGGFGLRQVADIALFSMEYADRIDWERIKKILTGLKADHLVRAVCKIAFQYLWKGYPAEKIFPGWDLEDTDEMPLLLDIMEGGLYGASSAARQHSSNITLHAMEQEQQTGNASQTGALLHAVFLPRKSLQNKYTYLKKAPFLLPLAWGHRIINYVMETGKAERGSEKRGGIKEGIFLGKQRIELLRKYNIIK